MARADSTIRVNIIGDATELTKATGKAEGAVGGLSKKLLAVGGAVAVGFATEQIFDFAQTALKESDRVSDAAGRLEKQLGKLSEPLIDAADQFSSLGQSEGDMLDLEARIADIGTAAGVADDKLAPLAEDAAVLAAKMALATDTDASEWIDKIGKALATNDFRVMKDLGINISDAAVASQALADTGKDSVDALTDQELAAARVKVVMGELEALYGDVGEGAADLEQKQADLDAKFETFTGKVGEAIEGPLSDLLGFFIAVIDKTETAATNLEAAGDGVDVVAQAIRRALGPLGDFIAGLDEAIKLLQTFLGLTGQEIPQANRPGSTGGGGSSSGTRQPNGTVTVNVQGGSPEVIEQSVIRALQQATGKGALQ